MQLTDMSAISLSIALNTPIKRYNLFYLIENPHFVDSVTGVVLGGSHQLLESSTFDSFQPRSPTKLYDRV